MFSKRRSYAFLEITVEIFHGILVFESTIIVGRVSYTRKRASFHKLSTKPGSSLIIPAIFSQNCCRASWGGSSISASERFRFCTGEIPTRRAVFDDGGSFDRGAMLVQCLLAKYQNCFSISSVRQCFSAPEITRLVCVRVRVFLVGIPQNAKCTLR